MKTSVSYIRNKSTEAVMSKIFHVKKIEIS